MGTLDDWMNFVKISIADDNINLIAHRLYLLETEQEKLRDALDACKKMIDQSLLHEKTSEEAK